MIGGGIQVYDGVTPELDRIGARMENRQGLMRVVAGEMRDALQEHFRGRNQSIYRRIAGDTQIETVTSTQATVAVGGESGPILWHKVEGGWVFPKTVTKLAIPSKQNPKPRVWPREYPEGRLVPLWGRNGVYALADASKLKKLKAVAKRAERAGGTAARKDAREQRLRGGARVNFLRGQLRELSARRRGELSRTRNQAVLFWLKDKVHHRADPKALPPQPMVEGRILARVRTEFAALLG